MTSFSAIVAKADHSNRDRQAPATLVVHENEARPPKRRIDPRCFWVNDVRNRQLTQLRQIEKELGQAASDATISDLSNTPPLTGRLICGNLQSSKQGGRVQIEIRLIDEPFAGLSAEPRHAISDGYNAFLSAVFPPRVGQITTTEFIFEPEERPSVLESSELTLAELLDQQSTYLAGGFADWLAPFAFTLSDKTESLRAEFIELVRRWRSERGYTSFTAEIVRCPSYRKIVAMGEDALPLIFERLRDEGDNPDHWDFALSEITGCDPVPEEAYGYMDRIAGCWLEWAEENGFGR